jgi:uncharacterized cofD-like protein
VSTLRQVVAIGGGGGATQVLQAVQPFADQLTAVIAVTDTGRSTGLARQIGNIPAPGDLRATIAAFATDQQFARLLQHRFNGAGIPQLEGMAFGNLLLAALAQVTGDFATAVAETAQLAGCAAQVLPVTTAVTHLCAELGDGTLVEGEFAVRSLNKAPIQRLFLSHPAPLHPPVREALLSADLITIGPGSLFTTVLAALLTEDLAATLRAAPGRIVYICNTTTQPGQTDRLNVPDHVARIVDLLGPGVLDYALINTSQPSVEQLAQYEHEGLFLLKADRSVAAAVAALGVQPILRDLAETVGEKRVLWNKLDTVRHSPAALQNALYDLMFDQ